jgi:outer membrane assembly lipoprotein YfiO
MSYLNWRSGEKAQALTTVERFIKLNPSSPALDYALYLKGVINFNDNLGLLGTLAGQDLSERDQRASRDSWQAFKQLLDQFPNSATRPMRGSAWTTSSTRWPATKCTWRATTSAGVPTWPRPTARSRR